MCNFKKNLFLCFKYFVNISFASLFCFFLFSQLVFAQSIVDENMGLKVFFERGMSHVTGDVQEINENTTLNDEWNISGYLRFVSKSDDLDSKGHSRWNGFNGAFPVSQNDFSKISLIFRKVWHGPENKTFSKEIKRFSLNDNVFIRKIGSQELDGNESTRDYYFNLEVSALEINFPMPLECMNPELFLYEFQVIAKGEKAFWNPLGTDFTVRNFEKVLSKRRFLVRDTSVPELQIITPLPKMGTTGDQVTPAKISLKIIDTNPNQSMDELYLTFSNRPNKKFFFKLEDNNPRRNYKENDAPSYISSDFSRTLSADDPMEAVLMPDNGSDLEYTIVGKPSFGPAVIMSETIENLDNDPPDLTFSIGTSVLDPAASGISIRVYGGVCDPIDRSTDVSLEYQYKGNRPVKGVIKEEKQGPWNVNLDSKFASIKVIPSIPEDQRLYYKASALDNVDKEVKVNVHGRGFTSIDSTGVVNIRESGKTVLFISASDSKGNTRKIQFTLTIREGSFRIETIGSD